MKLISLLLLSFALLLISYLLFQQLKENVRKKRYLVKKNPKGVLKILRLKLIRGKKLKYIVDYTAVRVGFLNNYSIEKNRDYSILIIFFLGALLFFFIGLVLPAGKVVWYILLFYLFLGIIITCILVYTLNALLSLYFTSQLPETFKILNSRFTTEEDILKAIDMSIEDFKGPIQREMTRIRNVLRKNNRQKINETFELLDKVHRNEYFSLLLNLILQAYFKGGRESIKKQFEGITEEILIDIENQKDLALTSRMYILLALLLPFGIRWLERFNEVALGEGSTAFYRTPGGIGMKMILLMTMLLFIAALLLLEKTI